MLKSTILFDLMSYSEPIDSESDLTEAAQIYFLRNSIKQINNHLTFQDEDLALQLIGIIDRYKNQENERICEAAFSVDDTVSFNVNLSAAKRKAWQKMNQIKAKREEKLAIREKFEHEHIDASINYINSSEEQKSDEEVYNLDMIIRKTKFKGKLGGVPLYSQRKHVSTFGTVKRFAPEPGSTQSKT